MSDQVTDDPIKNLKAEMERKLGNIETSAAQLQRTNEALMLKLSQMTAPVAPTAPQEKLSELLYSNPEKYAQEVANRAAHIAAEQSAAREAMARKSQNTMSELESEFPEIRDNSHPLSKRALEIYNSLPDDERHTSVAMKMAVRTAAMEEGIKPKSKRPVAEEPSYGSGGGYGMRPSKATKLNSVQEAWAEILGVDTSKPEVKARILANQNRDWSTPRPVPMKGKK